MIQNETLYDIGEGMLLPLRGSLIERISMVYVLDNQGKPLMSTKRHGWVRRALKDGRAVVKRRTPFTIQLTYESGHEKQDVTLGVDAGSKHIGLSASTEREELYASDIELRTDVSENIQTRAQMRRTRRGRKTRYRAPRFKNRKRKEGRLAPSVQHKIDCHIEAVRKVCRILPVTKIVVETAAFDTQKLKTEEAGLALPKGKEYQQGEQTGFWNAREYVLFRDGHKCVHCGKSNVPLNVHHLQSRKTGGDAPNNLVTLCKDCHKEFHSLSPDEQKKWKLPKRGKSYSDAAFMGIMRRSFYDRLKKLYPGVSMTFGYITKNTRICLGLGKSHVNDAFCIAGNLRAKPLDEYWYAKKKRRHCRQIHKFIARKGENDIRRRHQQDYVCGGFRAGDRVRYKGQECFVTARRADGRLTLKRIDGSTVIQSVQMFGRKTKTRQNPQNVRLLETAKAYMTGRMHRQFRNTVQTKTAV